MAQERYPKPCTTFKSSDQGRLANFETGTNGFVWFRKELPLLKTPHRTSLNPLPAESYRWTLNKSLERRSRWRRSREQDVSGHDSAFVVCHSHREQQHLSPSDDLLLLWNAASRCRRESRWLIQVLAERVLWRSADWPSSSSSDESYFLFFFSFNWKWLFNKNIFDLI